MTETNIKTREWVLKVEGKAPFSEINTGIISLKPISYDEELVIAQMSDKLFIGGYR